MNKTEYIEKYLCSELSDIQVTEFERLLEIDLSFKKEVQAHKDVNKFIKNLPEVEAFRKITSDAYNDCIKNRSGKKRSLLITYWKSTAAVVFILIVSTFLFYLLKPVSNQALAQQYFEHYDMDIYTRSVNSDFSLLEKSIDLYQEKKYEEAIISFSKLKNEDFDNSVVPFLCGISCFKINKNEEAIHFLTISCKNKQEVIYAQSCWYLALSLIQNNKLEEAIVILKQIKNNQSFNYKKSEELLKKLD